MDRRSISPPLRPRPGFGFSSKWASVPPHYYGDEDQEFCPEIFNDLYADALSRVQRVRHRELERQEQELRDAHRQRAEHLQRVHATHSRYKRRTQFVGEFAEGRDAHLDREEDMLRRRVEWRHRRAAWDQQCRDLEELAECTFTPALYTKDGQRAALEERRRLVEEERERLETFAPDTRRERSASPLRSRASPTPRGHAGVSRMASQPTPQIARVASQTTRMASQPSRGTRGSAGTVAAVRAEVVSGSPLPLKEALWGVPSRHSSIRTLAPATGTAVAAAFAAFPASEVVASGSYLPAPARSPAAGYGGGEGASVNETLVATPVSSTATLQAFQEPISWPAAHVVIPRVGNHTPRMVRASSVAAEVAPSVGTPIAPAKRVMLSARHSEGVLATYANIAGPAVSTASWVPPQVVVATPRHSMPMGSEQLPPAAVAVLVSPLPSARHATPLPSARHMTPLPSARHTMPLPLARHTTPLVSARHTTPLPSARLAEGVPASFSYTPVAGSFVPPVLTPTSVPTAVGTPPPGSFLPPALTLPPAPTVVGTPRQGTPMRGAGPSGPAALAVAPVGFGPAVVAVAAPAPGPTLLSSRGAVPASLASLWAASKAQ